MIKNVVGYFKDSMGILFYLLFLCFVLIVDPYKVSHNHCFFIGTAIIFSIIMLVLKYKSKANLFVVFSFIIIFYIFIVLVLDGGKSHFPTDKYLREIEVNNTTSLINSPRKWEKPQMLDVNFYMYYFKNKEIVCKDSYTEKKITLLLEESPYYNYTTKVDEEIEMDDNVNSIIPFYQRYVDRNGNVFIVGNELKTDKIVCIKNKPLMIFCSESVYKRIKAGNAARGSIKVQSNEEACSILAKCLSDSYSICNISHNMIIQFVSISILWLLGFLTCFALLDNIGGWMISMIALPVGVVIWTLTGLFLVIVRLPYNLISQGLCLVCYLVIVLRMNHFKIDISIIKKISIPVMLLLMATIYYTDLGNSVTSTDSLWKIRYGLMLAIDNAPDRLFTDVAIYGFCEPFVHSLGYMLGGDYIYTIYPMFFLTALGIITGGLYKICKNILRSNKYEYKFMYCLFICVIAIALLVKNFDFRYAKYYAMSHIIVSVFFLLLSLYVIFFDSEEFNGYHYVFYISALAIIITRSEGVLYVLFYLSIMLGFIRSKLFSRLCLTVSVSCIVWVIIQLMMYNGNDGGGYFFSPQKSTILIIGSLIMIAYTWIINSRLLNFITKKNYCVLYLGCLIVMTAIMVIAKLEMAIVNIGVYLGHLSNYIDTADNAGFLWGFVLMALSWMFIINTTKSNLTAGIIIGYLCLVYLIFLFRNELPMHSGIGDSARRLIVHIMPSAIFLVLANIILEIDNE